jgi:FkbH-like protein
LIAELMPEQITRAAQLTQRTNQFNFSGIRRSEAELRELCRAGGSKCLTVQVSDRFGDYGLVGIIIFELEEDAVKVDTFLLSCRALGRRVEHRMLSKLAELAQAHDRRYVEILFSTTSKNQPAFEFLSEIEGGHRQAAGRGWIFRLPVEVISIAGGNIATGTVS